MSKRRHFLEIKQIIEQNIDVVKVLEFYGARKIKKFPSGIRCCCPLHDGDNYTSFYFNTDTMTWYCFSRNCGEGISKDIFGFVYLAQKKIAGKRATLKDVISILLSFCNINITLDEIDFSYNKELYDAVDNTNFIKTVKSDKDTHIDLETLNYDTIAPFYKEEPSYLYTRGYSRKIISVFSIGFSRYGINEKHKIKDDFPGRVIVPVEHLDNSLVGLSGRLATDNKELINKYGKYRHLVDFQKGAVLYNLNRALPYIKREKSVIFVEGFFDVMRLYTFRVRNVVSLMGTSLTKYQRSLILPYVENVYLMLDSDEGGEKGTKRVAKQLKGLCNIYRIPLPCGKDPDDLSLKEFWLSFGRAKKIV